MKLTQPKPFFFQAGKRAVLLLHGFTGTSADVRMLGRFLEKEATLLMRHIIEGMVCHQRSYSFRIQSSGGRMCRTAINF